MTTNTIIKLPTNYNILTTQTNRIKQLIKLHQVERKLIIFLLLWNLVLTVVTVIHYVDFEPVKATNEQIQLESIPNGGLSWDEINEDNLEITEVL